MNKIDLTQDEIDYNISNLALPNQMIQVAVDYANNNTSSAQVEAYAKLSGSTWTYYVRSLNVVIGRTSEPASDENDVQIDLGPAKVVSRKHATIKYNGEFWVLTVCGRNGVKVDKISHKEGSTRLYSGNILDIGGVQMIFVLPGVKPWVAPGFRKKLYQLAPGSIKPNISSKPLESYPFVESPTSVPLPTTGSFNGSVPEPQYLGHRNVSNDPVASNFCGPQQPRITQMGINNYPAERQFQAQSQNDPSPAPYPYSAIPTSYTGQFNSNIPIVYDPGNVPQSKVAYPKGVAIISQPQVRALGGIGQYLDQDLSSDDCKDIKPPFSYATMISQAILSTGEHMMSLADIYEWISSRYSFYRFSKSGWQNSIRHNLSLNKAFEKVPRKANEPGKGMKWQIVQQFKEEFQKKAAQGDHIKGKSTIAQIQRQAQMRYSTGSMPNLPSIQNSITAGITTMMPQEAVDMEAATVVANLATSPQRIIDSKMPISPVTVKRDVSPVILKDHRAMSFSTPRKQSGWENSGPGNFSDQYGFTGTVVSDTANSSVFGSMSTPSPTHRYPTGQISQLEAYTPERGSSNGRLSSYRGGITPLVSKTTEVTSLSKMIATERLTHSISNKSSSSTISSNSSTSTISNPTSESRTFSNSVSKPSSSSNSTLDGSLATVSQTPAPMQSNLQLMAPTSAQQQELPSSFMPASSPAPFWKFMQLSSTPVRANDFSPTKFASPAVSSSLTPDFASSSRGPKSRGIGGAGVSKLGEGSYAKRSEDGALGDLQNVDLTR